MLSVVASDIYPALPKRRMPEKPTSMNSISRLAQVAWLAVKHDLFMR